MSSKVKNESKGMESIIKAVRDPLAFAVLIVLVVDGTLGGLAAKGPNQLVALYGLFFFLAITLAFVAYLAVCKPDLLRRKAQSSEGSAELFDFADKLSGYWWESITSEEGVISWVSVTRDPATPTVKLNGYMYDSDGVLKATWESAATCITLGERKLFYYWIGRHISRPSETYEGIGEIDFQESLNNATGRFSDANLADMKTATIKMFGFKRSTKEEEDCLRSGDDKSIGELVRGKLHATAS